jgi:effector-binding domain-containing protein
MVGAYLEELGIEPSGAPFVAYLNCAADWSNYDVEVGFPIAEAVAEKDGMCMSKTHAGKAVVAIHKGAHRSLNTTYGKMFAFMQEHSLAFTGTFYDCYLTDPATTPTKEMQTKVIIPI